MKEPSDRTKQEQAAGRRLVTKNMLEGLIDQICSDYKLKRDSVKLNLTSDDPRQWTVGVTLTADIVHTENAWVFPSDELKAMVMLIRK